MFCHEGPWHLVQKIWIVKASTHEVYPILPMEKYIERAEYKFFTSRGRIVAQFARRDSLISKEWISYDVLMNSDGTDVRMFRYPYIPSAHIRSKDEGFLSVIELILIDHSRVEIIHRTHKIRGRL